MTENNVPVSMPKRDRHNDGTAEYNAAAISVLGGREAVRRRPGMYIGSTDQRGLHHLVYEIITTASTKPWPATARISKSPSKR